jgi:hypothetical protein
MESCLDLSDESPEVSLLLGLQLEEIGKVALGDNECVAWADREEIRNGGRATG